MFEPHEYELLDFSRGEKLERFGITVTRRQTPSVPDTGYLISDSATPAQICYRRVDSTGAGRWTGDVDGYWQTSHRGITFQLRATKTGQVGVFPEQASNWDWIYNSRLNLQGLNAINLFGYTGGTTLALAKAGAKVTHVDAAKTAVSWARENATVSGLKDYPIRWITEDAMRFVEREIKRGKHYDIFVADPPSFGRGPSGETWKLERDLANLLSSAALLTSSRPTMIIITCHTPGYDALRLGHEVARAWNLPNGQIESGVLKLSTAAGRHLPCGEYARWQSTIANGD